MLVTPLGIWLALKLIPAQVMQDARRQAGQALDPSLEETSGMGGEEVKKFRRLGTWVVVFVWGIVAVSLGVWIIRYIWK